MIFKSIVISGLDRTGKSTLANSLESRGYSTFECGEYVQKLIPKHKHLSTSEFYNNNIQSINDKIISHSLDIEINKLVFVGVRSIDLLKKIEAISKKIIILFVTAKFEIRYKRHLKNPKNTLITSRDTLQKNDEIQYTWGLKEIEKKADITIINNKSKKYLTALVKEMDLL